MNSKQDIETSVQAMFEGIKALTTLAKGKVIPILNNQIGLKPQEQAIVGTYFRMYAWMDY
tara:strand:+ start:226 stop:405 length:180 start_codon:yes stop_codon:yes gene_type:complete